MVYIKRNYRKRKSYAKKPTWRKYAGQALMSGGKSGLKVLKKALGLNTETNYLDTTQSSTASTTLTLLNNIITIPEGDTTGARQGSGIRMSRMKCTILASSDPTCTFTQLFRVIAWVQPKCLAGTLITATQIVSVVTDIKTPYNMDTEGYNIIYDKVISLDAIGSGTSSKIMTINYAPLDHQIKWLSADTTGASSNVTAGMIRIAVMCLSATTPPTFASYTRVYFVDN